MEDHPSWSGGARTTTRQVNGIGPNLDAWRDPKIFTEKNTQKATSSAFILVRLCCQHHSSGRKSWNTRDKQPVTQLQHIGSWWWEIIWCFILITVIWKSSMPQQLRLHCIFWLQQSDSKLLVTLAIAARWHNHLVRRSDLRSTWFPWWQEQELSLQAFK